VTAPLRWPAHPPPGADESLSSWLTRVAEDNGLFLEDLVRYNLGTIEFDTSGRDSGGLDLDPPAAVITAVHERTGVPLDRIRQMTIAGWAPWLLDTMKATDDPAAFNTFVHQDSVLLAPGRWVDRETPRWRPWLPTTPMHRACPQCVDQDERRLTLMSQIPLLLTCPEHGCRLQPNYGTLGEFLFWDNPGHLSREAGPEIIAMDRRTHEALTTGIVELPRRAVHAGVWFRLLRTLLDELNTPASHARSQAKALEQIWRATDRPARGVGLTKWRPYEDLPWTVQQATLEAAAVAIRLIEDGDISAKGTLGPLFLVEPHQPIPDGDPPVSTAEPITYWERAMDAFNIAVETARHDPDTARHLFQLASYTCRSPSCFDSIAELLVEVGIPASFLSHYPELDRSRVVD
jgi:TniQ